MRGKLSQSMEAVVQRCSVPVETRRRFNVYKMSIQCQRRRINVLQTLKQRLVSTNFLVSTDY